LPYQLNPQPKVANNCSTINDRYGAIAAVSETQDGFRFVPFAAVVRITDEISLTQATH
jgi:hypothetical protein